MYITPTSLTSSVIAGSLHRQDQKVQVHVDPSSIESFSFISGSDYFQQHVENPGLFEVSAHELNANFQHTFYTEARIYLIQLYEDDIAGEWAVRPLGPGFKMSFSKENGKWCLKLSSGEIVPETDLLSEDTDTDSETSYSSVFLR